MQLSHFVSVTFQAGSTPHEKSHFSTRINNKTETDDADGLYSSVDHLKSFFNLMIRSIG